MENGNLVKSKCYQYNDTFSSTYLAYSWKVVLLKPGIFFTLSSHNILCIIMNVLVNDNEVVRELREILNNNIAARSKAESDKVVNTICLSYVDCMCTYILKFCCLSWRPWQREWTNLKKCWARRKNFYKFVEYCVCACACVWLCVCVCACVCVRACVRTVTIMMLLHAYNVVNM